MTRYESYLISKT